MKFAIIALLCLMSLPIRAQTGLGSAFRVRVVDSPTGSPISGARVTVASERAEQIFGRTDSTGVFAGRSPASGVHLVTVVRQGYRMFGGAITGKPIELQPGSETQVTLEMQALGVITGRVVDQYGDPIRHALARTEDVTVSPGREQYFQSSWAAETDDLGQYRIADVEPGMHYVAAEYSSTRQERTPGGRSRFEWPQTGGVVLYPDATSIEQADQVEVTAGQTIHLKDIRLNIQRAVAISGRIKAAPSGVDPSLSLEPKLKLALNTSPMVQGGSSKPDGTFKLNVLPGDYILTASDQKTGKVSKPITLEVRDRNLTGIELELTSGYEVRGRISVDGTDQLDFTKLQLNLGVPVKIDDSGIFEVKLTSSKATYALQNLPEGWYVKESRVAGQRIMSRQVEIEPGISDMSIVLSPRAARIELGLQIPAGSLPPTAVFLLPEDGPIPDIESIPSGEPDEASRRFIFQSVPPGSYRIFTFDSSNWGLALRPDILLQKYRAFAPLVTVSDGERKTMVVPVSKLPQE